MIAQNNDEPSEPVGDIGGLRAKGLNDTRLLERALRERWPIPDQYREPIINRQVRIAMDPNSSPREATSAARCLVSMEQQNADIALKMLDKLVPDQHEHGEQQINIYLPSNGRETPLPSINGNGNGRH